MKSCLPTSGGWEKYNKQENKPNKKHAKQKIKIKNTPRQENKKNTEEVEEKKMVWRQVKKGRKEDEWSMMEGREKMQILDHNLKAYKALIKSFKKSNRCNLSKIDFILTSCNYCKI